MNTFDNKRVDYDYSDYIHSMIPFDDINSMIPFDMIPFDNIHSMIPFKIIIR